MRCLVLPTLYQLVITSEIGKLQRRPSSIDDGSAAHFFAYSLELRRITDTNSEIESMQMHWREIVKTYDDFLGRHSRQKIAVPGLAQHRK